MDGCRIGDSDAANDGDRHESLLADESIEELLARALVLDPYSVDGHRELVSWMRQQGDTEAALAEYRTVLQLAPADVSARLALAEMMPATEGTEDASAAEHTEVSPAEAAVYRAIKIDPSVAEPYAPSRPMCCVDRVSSNAPSPRPARPSRWHRRAPGATRCWASCWASAARWSSQCKPAARR